MESAAPGSNAFVPVSTGQPDLEAASPGRAAEIARPDATRANGVAAGRAKPLCRYR